MNWFLSKVSVFILGQFRYAVEYSYPKETKRMKPCAGKVDILARLSHRFTNFTIDSTFVVKRSRGRSESVWKTYKCKFYLSFYMEWNAV